MADSTAQFCSPLVAARRLDISARRVRQLLRTGKLPGTRIGRSWRIPIATLDRYIRDLEARASANLRNEGSA